MDLSTVAIVAGRGAGAPGEPLSVPVALASTYRAGGEGPHYGRDGNPTWAALEAAIGALEGGSALAFASGMAAAAAVFDSLPAGAVVVAPTRGYHGVRRLLADAASRGHLRVRLANVSDGPGTVAMCRGADLLWIESPTNPLLEIADIALLAGGAHSAGVRVAVDNTLATPLLQRPLDLGADVVVHSATKLLSGHSDLVMGAAVTRDPEIAASLAARRSMGGAVPGPLEAFLALRGLRTLPLRLERAQASAGELARRLSGHPAVATVSYPGLPDAPGHELAGRQMRGFGTMVAFDVHGGAIAANAACDAVQIIVTATSLGGVETMIERRARWPGEELTSPGLLRLSVGLEHVEDLWADLDAALMAPRPAHRARRDGPAG